MWLVSPEQRQAMAESASEAMARVPPPGFETRAHRVIFDRQKMELATAAIATNLDTFKVAEGTIDLRGHVEPSAHFFTPRQRAVVPIPSAIPAEFIRKPTMGAQSASSPPDGYSGQAAQAVFGKQYAPRAEQLRGMFRRKFQRYAGGTALTATSLVGAFNPSVPAAGLASRPAEAISGVPQTQAKPARIIHITRTNYAGVEVRVGNNDVKAEEGSLIVPKTTCTTPTSESVGFIGITNTNAVGVRAFIVQGEVDEICDPTTLPHRQIILAEEGYPAGPITIQRNIHVGDDIDIKDTHIRGREYSISMTDISQGTKARVRKFFIPKRFSRSANMIEGITELIHGHRLPKLGPTDFLHLQTETTNGRFHSLTSLMNRRSGFFLVNMINSSGRVIMRTTVPDPELSGDYSTRQVG